MDVLPHKRVLIVDDEEADRMLLSAYLTRQGCQISYAQDGAESIERARLLQPDIILMDYDMPGCNGVEACKNITQDPRTQHIPVIFISGMTASAQRVRGLLAGAVDYINKPFDFNEVKLRLIIHLKKSASIVPANSSPKASLQSIQFHNARAHLLQCLADTPTMKELEKLTNANSKQLNSAFKKYAGTTVYEYLREERMKQARLLLANTTTPIQEIADEIGFSDTANFSTAFKKRFGLSPREFRQQHS